jgi:hypothetical protein
MAFIARSAKKPLDAAKYVANTAKAKFIIFRSLMRAKEYTGV